jgi:transposase InsO family protein
MTFAFMHAEKARHPIRTMCRTFGVSASGYYAWQQRRPSRRSIVDRRLRVELCAAHRESDGSYGSPRLRTVLRTRGLRVGRNRVMRLMRDEQLVGRPRRRFRITTEADPRRPAAANHLRRRFRVRRRNHVWAADITAIPTGDGWLYLAVLLDLYSRRVVGWAIDTTMETSLVLTAWQRALAQRRTAPQLHHSDRGRQYTSTAYQAALSARGVRCSMSRRGNCYDNAVVESFFRTLKLDLNQPVWRSRTIAIARIGAYIDGYYNIRRLHSTLGYCSPAAFEQRRRRAA